MEHERVDGMKLKDKYKLLKEYWEDPKLSEERRRIHMQGSDKFYLSLVTRDLKATFGFKHWSEKPNEPHIIITKYKSYLKDEQ